MNSIQHNSAGLTIEKLSKMYNRHAKALDDLSLTIQAGELVSFLGPSGCGKTTTLNCIAGLEHPDTGIIRVEDFVLTDSANRVFLPPEDRHLGMVFQSYALWPHMTVADNVSFGLRVAKVATSEIKQRVATILELVGLGHVSERYPFQLSGGQQQRVALARAVVTEPRLLLLDEPLSNLDAKVREQARTWLRDIQKRLGITTVYVTHDQAEALAMSDKIAVMSAGKLEQFDTPQMIYEQPATRFVAEFIGATTFFPATVVRHDLQTSQVRLSDGTCLDLLMTPRLQQLSNIDLGIRSERVQVATSAQHINVIAGAIRSSDYLGAKWQHQVETAIGAFMIETLDHVSGNLRIYLPPEALMVLKAA